MGFDGKVPSGKRFQFANWKDPPFYSRENSQSIDWAIFNSYATVITRGYCKNSCSKTPISPCVIYTLIDMQRCGPKVPEINGITGW